MAHTTLLQKYNVPTPRYTSYPTVPIWQEGIDVGKWTTVFAEDFKQENSTRGISLYIHLPFCESLCTYCGCNKKITTNHSVEGEYIGAILKEWDIYISLMDAVPVVRELHLGGGTPTFFSSDNLKKLIKGILKKAKIHPNHDFSFEGHPNNTTEDHLRALYQLGFRRVSFGVQDNDPEVQRIINRIQPFENVKRVTELARAIGYKSVNFDLIYGLPRQTLSGMSQTIDQVLTLMPDRVAFYSYAHVPWTSRGQRLFDESDLPDAALKLALYQTGKHLFTVNGYNDIGMDHFSLPKDDLNVASKEGRLHRNFMGYTTQQTAMLIGLGVSSISTTPGAFAQNHKTIQHYYQAVNAGELAVTKGYFMTEEDKRFGKYILDISCRGTTTIQTEDADLAARFVYPALHDVVSDGLVEVAGSTISVTTKGKNFIRNICACFDLYIQRTKNQETANKFSKAI